VSALRTGLVRYSQQRKDHCTIRLKQLNDSEDGFALMGHVSRAMLERYSHIRMAAKREAVAAMTLGPLIENSEVIL
jgi:hypothetical protein